MDILVNKTIGFIGGGQMAEAILGGVIKSGAVKASSITVCDTSEDRLSKLSTNYNVKTILNNSETNDKLKDLVEQSNIVILAIKPQHVLTLLDALKPILTADHLLISILAGCDLSTLENGILAPVVRVMPNTPMLLQEGACGIVLGKNCNSSHEQIAISIFSAVSKVNIIPEYLINALTSVSGCGPAYAYLFIEAMADGGVNMGLPRDMAIQLAAQTLLGSAKMVLETGEHPGKLKDNVCSPGGFTIAGVAYLEETAFRGSVMGAVKAGMDRMIEFGKK